MTPRPTFEIEFPPVTLTIEEVWPDGDAPANPTAAQVAELLKRAGLAEWNLVPDEALVTKVSSEPGRDSAEVTL